MSLFLARLQTFRAIPNDSETMTHHELQSHQNHRLAGPATIQTTRFPMRADDFSECRRANGAAIVKRIL
jgi:hypothetical protein